MIYHNGQAQQTFLAGRGDVLVPDLYHNNRPLFDTLWGEDLNISYKNRVAFRLSKSMNVLSFSTKSVFLSETSMDPLLSLGCVSNRLIAPLSTTWDRKPLLLQLY